MDRRTFLGTALGAMSTVSILPQRAWSANDEIRLGVIGVGSTVKIGGKGRADIRDFRAIDGVRVAAVCDCDAKHLDWLVDQSAKWGEKVFG